MSALQDSRPLLDREQHQTLLVVDDSRAQRHLLATSLRRAGFTVLEAESGEDALKITSETSVDIVLSDWMMPGMSGLEFCQAFRAQKREGYGYFILLTSKTGKDVVAQGLDVGADDFLAKPVNAGELRARIAAGQRILDMEAELRLKNAAMDRDLAEARKLQMSLVRERFRNYPGADLSLFLRPSGHVGGDLVGAFPIGPKRIGVYAVDVSGHGITSALITARVAGFFSAAPAQNVAMKKVGTGFAPRPVDEVADRLNRLTLQEIDTEHYFTLLYAVVDLETGDVEMVQAGHPTPVILRSEGGVSFVGKGGMPVGLIEQARYSTTRFQLHPGDRLVFFSDGLSECPGPTGTLLEEEGVAVLLLKNQTLTGTAMLEALIWDLGSYAESQEFPDDISVAMLEFYGDGNASAD